LRWGYQAIDGEAAVRVGLRRVSLCGKGLSTDRALFMAARVDVPTIKVDLIADYASRHELIQTRPGCQLG
jgi:hypothetical protein